MSEQTVTECLPYSLYAVEVPCGGDVDMMHHLVYARDEAGALALAGADDRDDDDLPPRVTRLVPHCSRYGRHDVSFAKVAEQIEWYRATALNGTAS